MNGKACKGIIATKVALEAYMKGDRTQLDPSGSIIDTKEDWTAMKKEKPERRDNEYLTEGDAVAACRDWYDWKQHGKPFCCQMMLEEDSGNKYGYKLVVDAPKTVDAEAVTFDDGSKV